MSEEDYCKKIWEDKQMDEEAERITNDSMSDGFVSGIKWGGIIIIPLFMFFVWMLEK